MNLLERYIAKTILLAIALVTLMLVGLQVFILFVEQIDSLGQGYYGVAQASSYVFLQMPWQVYLFFPMASLLGCLIGLGIMANHHELVVMRAAGMSTGQITLAVLKASIIVIILVTVLGETIMPGMVRYANDLKARATSNGQVLRASQWLWIRNGNDFLVGIPTTDHTLEQVVQFDFDETHQLRLARRIGRLDYEHGAWQAYDVAETKILDDETLVDRAPKMIWDVPLKPRVLGIGNNAPDEMTLIGLYRYMQEQKRSHLSTTNLQLVFWQRIIQPFTTMVMMVLAIPFIFGPLRSSTMGSKLLAGAAVGFGFHIVNRFLGAMSQVYQFQPELAAVGPTLIFALLGFWMMRRVK